MTNVNCSKRLSKAILMCSLAGLFYLYEYVLRVAPASIKIELQQFFNISDFGYGYLASCYYIAYIVMQIPVGVMMDRYGPRKILTLACWICVVGTLMFAHGNLLVAQIGRFLVGFGSAFAYVGVLKIATVWLPERWFPIIAGCCTALGMIGAISGSLLVAILAPIIEWQNTLDLLALLGIVLMVFLWLFLSDGKEDHESISRALETDEETGLVCSVKDSLMTMLRSKICWINGLIGCLAYLPINAFAELWSVSYLENLGYEKFTASKATSLVFLGFAIGGPIAGALSEKLKSRKWPLAFGLLGASFSMACLFWLQPLPVLIVFLLLFLSGFFAGFKVISFAIAYDLEKGINHATAIAFTNMMIMLGGIFVQPYVGKLLDLFRTLEYTASGNIVVHENYVLALSMLPIGLLLGSIMTFTLMPDSYRLHNRARN